MRAPEYATVAELLALYRKRAASPVEVVKDLLARIAKHESSLHCFVTLTPERTTGTHGGKRLRRCPDHPDAELIRDTIWTCSECGQIVDRATAHVHPEAFESAHFQDENAPNDTTSDPPRETNTLSRVITTMGLDSEIAPPRTDDEPRQESQSPRFQDEIARDRRFWPGLAVYRLDVDGKRVAQPGGYDGGTITEILPPDQFGKQSAILDGERCLPLDHLEPAPDVWIVQ